MKITIQLDYTLDELKNGYRNYFNEKGKVTKADVVRMLSGFAQADIGDFVDKQDYDTI